MPRKSGLGRGMEALMLENSGEEAGKVVSLPILEIVPNRDQPRRSFDEDKLAELTESIAQHGVLQPLLVRPMPDGTYQLVAGERRWRAARAAGLAEVPVTIRAMTDKEAAQLALIENLQREDLNPMEEAGGYRTLMENYGLTQEETAKIVNKSRPAVTNKLRLLELPGEVAALVEGGRLSESHARTLLAFPTSEQQVAVAREAVAKELSVRRLEAMAKAAKAEKKTGKEAPVTAFAKNSFYSEVELALAEHLGRRVTVSPAKKGGVLQLEFYDEEDLKALANRLAPEK